MIPEVRYVPLPSPGEDFSTPLTKKWERGVEGAGDTGSQNSFFRVKSCYGVLPEGPIAPMLIKRRETDRDSQKSGKETTHQAEKQAFISRKSPSELG